MKSILIIDCIIKDWENTLNSRESITPNDDPNRALGQKTTAEKAKLVAEAQKRLDEFYKIRQIYPTHLRHLWSELPLIS